MSNSNPVPQPTTVAQVEVQSAWASKINWAQGIGVIATLIALVSGNKYQIPVETQLSIVTGIQAVQAAVTWITKTWFNKTITPAVAALPDIPTKTIMK